MAKKSKKSKAKEVFVETQEETPPNSIGDLIIGAVESRFPLGDAKRLKIHFKPEVPYVRRTAAEFRDGAELLRPNQSSHRMSRINVSVSQEIKAAITSMRKQNGIDQMKWFRAAIRYALRNHDPFNPKAELETDFTLSFQNSKSQHEPLEIHIAPEVKYMKRASVEFSTKAKEPPKNKTSHEMSLVNVLVSPEIKTAIKVLCKHNDIAQMKWLRAAIRFALKNHDTFNPMLELETDFTLVFNSNDVCLEI